MCYSAIISQKIKDAERRFHAVLEYDRWHGIYEARLDDDKIKIPQMMDARFLGGESAADRRIAGLIEEYRSNRRKVIEAELFKQKKRLADSERALKTKETKKALNDRRIAANKIEKGLKSIEDLNRTEIKSKDCRIFPFHYAPVIAEIDGRRLILPMRYLCRRAGKPAKNDIDYPGCYNARRDNLEAFWKGQFGHTHAIAIVTGFYENVSRHRLEGRELAPGEKEENAVIHFNPRPESEMLIACLWSHWTGEDGQALDSFAAITDEPPPEVAAAGHDRCIIPIKELNVEAWLNPHGDLEVAHAILDDREKPFYEHRLAA
jgi:putative SOS response-associated peptidase YedK